MAHSRDNRVIRLAHDYESITVPGTATTLTAAKAALADRAFISVETGQTRFRYDGTAPTATEGHLLGCGDALVIEGTQNLENFQAIRTNTTSAVLKVTYEV